MFAIKENRFQSYAIIVYPLLISNKYVLYHFKIKNKGHCFYSEFKQDSFYRYYGFTFTYLIHSFKA
jgi:hypothetical protein